MAVRSVGQAVGIDRADKSQAGRGVTGADAIGHQGFLKPLVPAEQIAETERHQNSDAHHDHAAGHGDDQAEGRQDQGDHSSDQRGGQEQALQRFDQLADQVPGQHEHRDDKHVIKKRSDSHLKLVSPPAIYWLVLYAKILMSGTVNQLLFTVPGTGSGPSSSNRTLHQANLMKSPLFILR